MINSRRLLAKRFSERKTLIKRSEVDRLFECAIPATVFRVEPKKKEYKIEDCYTVAEAEKVSQMSAAVLYNYIKRNNIPKYQKGKYVFMSDIYKVDLPKIRQENLKEVFKILEETNKKTGNSSTEEEMTFIV